MSEKLYQRKNGGKHEATFDALCWCHFAFASTCDKQQG